MESHSLILRIRRQWLKTSWLLMELIMISSIITSLVDLAKINRHALIQSSRKLVEDQVPLLLLTSDSNIMSPPTHVLSQVKWLKMKLSSISSPASQTTTTMELSTTYNSLITTPPSASVFRMIVNLPSLWAKHGNENVEEPFSFHEKAVPAQLTHHRSSMFHFVCYGPSSRISKSESATRTHCGESKINSPLLSNLNDDLSLYIFNSFYNF